MPNYLTPGVYVEEIPAQSKPIEGVATSIAAFVGLAPGGPLNKPMRISNWTQFAKLYGDPAKPDNGPFMDGAYLAHSVYGFFQNGGGRAGSCASAPTRLGPGPAPGRAAGRHRTAASRPSARWPARASTATSSIELIEEAAKLREAPEGEGEGEAKPAGDGALHLQGVRGGGTRGDHERPHPQEGPQQHPHQGQRDLAADHARGDRRRAAGGPARPAAGSYKLAAPTAAASREVDPGLRGRRRPARGHGRPGRGRRDHDGLHARPDDARRPTATTPQLRDLQGKMIVHGEMNRRPMAILDAAAEPASPRTSSSGA